MLHEELLSRNQSGTRMLQKGGGWLGTSTSLPAGASTLDARPMRWHSIHKWQSVGLYFELFAEE
jgi:hypothetical protein